MELDKTYWEQRYQNGETGWDIGYASPQIIDYFNSINTKEASILIPGCGNAHEAKELLKLGFTNISLIDIA